MVPRSACSNERVTQHRRRRRSRGMIVGPVPGLGSDRYAQDPRGMFLGEPADPLATVAGRRRSKQPFFRVVSVVLGAHVLLRAVRAAPPDSSPRGLPSSPLTQFSAPRSSPAAPASAADGQSLTRSSSSPTCVPLAVWTSVHGHQRQPRGSGRSRLPQCSLHAEGALAAQGASELSDAAAAAPETLPGP
jgi:hypothetical protein